MYLPVARRARRGGFTLIELLTVVAILALLVALVASGISKVRAAQMARNTEGTVTKLQLALDDQWKAVVAQCKQDRLKNATGGQFQTVLAYCGGDADRAEALWCYLNLKRELPQSFAEATSPVRLLDAANNPVLVLQPRKTFASATGGVPAPPNGAALAPADAEAAVLLYLILTEKAGKGAGFSADDATAGAQTTLGSFRVFTDAWGTPITFVRHANATISPELGGAPYATTPAATLTNPNPTPDPLDPLGKLTSPAGAWTAALKGAAQASLNSPAVTPGVTFGEAKAATVVAAGRDMAFSGSNSDDFFGYRYRRQGNK